MHPVHSTDNTVPAAAPAFREYPEQPVHPVLADRLYQRTRALQQRWTNTDLPLDLDSRVVAAALRRLDKDGRHLWPRRTEDLEALVADALRTLNFYWGRNAASDFSEQRRAAQAGKPGRRHTSLEALHQAGWSPCVEMYDPDDQDGGERGRFVRSRIEAMGYTSTDAQTLFRRLVTGASWNDLTYERYGRDENEDRHRRHHEALRKWGNAQLKKVIPRLQSDLAVWGIERTTPEHSRRGSGVRISSPRKNRRWSVPNPPDRRALPEVEGDQAMHITNNLSFARTDHFCERQGQRQVRDHEIALALRYGVRVHDQGDRVYFLGRRHLPAVLPPDIARRAEGTVVIVTPDNALKTTFRNPRYLRRLKRRQR